MTTSIEIETPPTYAEYQDFLPPFITFIDTVLAELLPYYKTYRTTNAPIDSDECICVFLREYGDEKDCAGTLHSYSKKLESIISYQLVFHTEFNFENEKLMVRISKLRDEACEEWEDRHEVFEEIQETAVEGVEGEIMEQIRYMEIAALNKMLDIQLKKKSLAIDD